MNIHYIKNPGADDKDQSGQNQGEQKDIAEKRANDIIHFLLLFSAQCLRNQNLSGVGETEADHGGKVNDLATLRYRREPGGTDIFADNDHINGAVKYLQRIRCHKRQRE